MVISPRDVFRMRHGCQKLDVRFKSLEKGCSPKIVLYTVFSSTKRFVLQKPCGIVATISINYLGDSMLDGRKKFHKQSRPIIEMPSNIFSLTAHLSSSQCLYENLFQRKTVKLGHILFISLIWLQAVFLILRRKQKQNQNKNEKNNNNNKKPSLSP